MEIEFNIFLLFQKIIDKINNSDFINDFENYKNFYIRNKKDTKIDGIPSIFVSNKFRTSTSINGRTVSIFSIMEFETGYFIIRFRSDNNLEFIIVYKGENKRLIIDVNLSNSTFSLCDICVVNKENYIYQNRSLNDGIDIIESILITDGTSKLTISKKNMEILTNALR